MGALGEILLVDPVQGTLVGVLDRHRQTVCALAFSPDGRHLASTDVSGCTIAWSRDAEWKPRVLNEPDANKYGAEAAARIASEPRVRPLAFTDPGRLVVPEYIGADANGGLRWQLRLVDLADPTRSENLPTIFHGLVTALASSGNGTLLAGADLAGALHLVNLEAPRKVRALDPKGLVLSLAIGPNAKTLAAGTAIDPEDSSSQIRVWDLPSGRQRTARRLRDHVAACAISRDARWLAYSGGSEHEVQLLALDDDARPVSLQGTGRRVLKVAFAAEKPYYRIALGTRPRERALNDYAELDEGFNLETMELAAPGKVDAEDYIAPDWWKANWKARIQGGTVTLAEGERPRGAIRLDPARDGNVRCYCWIPDRDGKPCAIALGTDRQNAIFVYRIAGGERPTLLRHFRGHADTVASVGVSRDLRYLASGSADGTVKLWSLKRLAEGRSRLGRWGAKLDVRIVGGEEQLVVTEIEPAGPLFRRGVRLGDSLRRIRWHDGQEGRTETNPVAILKALAEVPWQTQVVFETAREGRARPAFQLLPAWQPMASLFVDSRGQWALWTPEGYYDASVEGHRLFGWQVNRGLNRLPDFYRADQFRKKLERGDVMRRLLPAGDLDAALRQAAAEPPAEPHRVIEQQIALTPRVEILNPRPGSTIQADRAEVTARIHVPDPGRLVRAKLFANGVVAPRRRITESKDVEGGKELTYQFEVPLAADEKHLIQLVVGTDTEVTAFRNVLVEREKPRAEATPRLYLVALGVNAFADEEIPRLTFSAADATEVAEAIRKGSRGLYEVKSSQVLLDAEVTPKRWRETLVGLKSEIAQRVGPDDVLVLFLAGHGIVDEKTGRYYYLGHDFTMEDFGNRDYARCISWEDFQVLADVPCRKVAILDTCHSGAVQPMRSRNLKAAVRALQDDVIFTITASAGSEKAAEKEEWGHGALTKSILEALAGGADESADGVVTLNEAVVYVKQSVPALTGNLQNPMAGPSEFLAVTSLPLTAVGGSGPKGR